jgi:hypothetical protein
LGRNKGICTLCGTGGPLSFEHVPPEGGLNVRGVVMYSLEDWMQRESLEALPNGIPQPEGTGVPLCVPCNGFLGKHYVPAHNRLVHAGLDCLAQVAPRLEEFDARPQPTLLQVGLAEIDRLACAKQIVSMLLVTSGRNVVVQNPDLESFVRNPQAQRLPARYRLFLNLCAGPAARVTGLSGIVRVPENESTAVIEVAYVPFAYSLLFDNPGINQGTEITDWAAAPFGEWMTVHLNLRLGFTHTIFPCDLRTRQQIEQARVKGDQT